MKSSANGLWLKSAKFDLFWIIGPAFFSSFAVLLLFPWTGATSDVSPLIWIIFVLGIDVSHVYATLYRTYWNQTEFEKYRTPLLVAPLACWLTGVFFYSLSPLLFWRVLAYLAAFHFVRQQYGFFAIYARKNAERLYLIDKLAIYLPMLFALTYWHTHLPREFHWFVDGDFFSIGIIWATPLMLGAWIISWTLYVFKEWRRPLNPGKQLILLGTALSWNVGIVLLNSDLAFTITNVTAHGVPYFALLWLYGKNLLKTEGESFFFGRLRWRHVFSGAGVLIYVGVLFCLAYLEEGLWDALVWREHLSFFPILSSLPAIELRATLTWLVPLLALPQATHYVIDGFIWRLKKPELAQSPLFNNREALA